jgi:hypothetical protein
MGTLLHEVETKLTFIIQRHYLLNAIQNRELKANYAISDKVGWIMLLMMLGILIKIQSKV